MMKAKNDYETMFDILAKSQDCEAFYLDEDDNYDYIIIPADDCWYDCIIKFDKKGNIIGINL